MSSFFSKSSYVNNNNLLTDNIDKKLIEIKQMLESSNLYMSEHFNNLRNQVDLESETLLLDRKNINTYKKQQIISKNRELMIDRINSFEKQCLEKGGKISPEIVNEVKNLLKMLEIQLISRKTFEEIEIIEKILDTEILKLKKILFKNKSLLFLKKQCYVENDDTQSVSFGKLIFMNQLFSSYAIQIFIK
jgi:hypothetical protein